MHLGFGYDLALSRQAELLRWAEDQRKIKLLRSSQTAERTAPMAVRPGVDPTPLRPIEKEAPQKRRAS